MIELGFTFVAQVMANQDQGQVRVGQQALLHDVGVLLVQGAGALIHQQDAAVMDQSTGDGHALLLAAREGVAFLAHRRIQTLGHIGKVACQGAVTQCLFHLLVGKVLTQGNVLTDGGIEQEHILFDVAHFLLELLGRVIPHVSLVIKDLALVAGQPAQKNLQQGALAAAGGTGEGVFAAFLEFRVHVDQDRLLFIVAERDILDRNALPAG